MSVSFANGWASLTLLSNMEPVLQSIIMRMRNDVISNPFLSALIQFQVINFETLERLFLSSLEIKQELRQFMDQIMKNMSNSPKIKEIY